MDPVPTNFAQQCPLRPNFPEERSAFVCALGPCDRSVGGTACSSGPTQVRISHQVLRRCAHARIGGCARSVDRRTRPGADAQKETMAAPTPCSTLGPWTHSSARRCPPAPSGPTGVTPELRPVHELATRPPAAVRKGTHPKRRGRATCRQAFALSFPISSTRRSTSLSTPIHSTTPMR